MIAAQHPTYQNQRRPAKSLGFNLLGNIRQRPHHPILIRPGRPVNHRDRTVRTVMRQQFDQDLLQMIDSQMDRHGGSMLRQAAQLFAGRHRRLVGVAGQNHAL
ncbi:hypothetical protein D3C87_1742890 [compost metagenome]